MGTISMHTLRLTNHGIKRTMDVTIRKTRRGSGRDNNWMVPRIENRGGFVDQRVSGFSSGENIILEGGQVEVAAYQTLHLLVMYLPTRAGKHGNDGWPLPPLCLPHLDDRL